MQSHIDPLNTLIVIAAFLGIWFTQRNRHQESQVQQHELLTRIQINQATLTEIVGALKDRVERIERKTDSQ